MSWEVLIVSPGAAADDPSAEVAARRIPPVDVVTAPIRRSASSSDLDFIVSPAESTTDGEPAIDVVAGGFPAPSDDKLD